MYRRRFAVWPEALRATEEIAEMCSFAGPGGSWLMPPWEQKTKRGAEQTLREQAYQGARQRYGETLSESVHKRLEHELGIIEKMGFSS
ncbi:MAG: hypothetical protein N2C12_10915, partial [Planctomycetales bacterium]